MNSGLAYIKGAVADVHAPALKAVAERVGHGIAKLPQLALQLLLHLFSLVGAVFCITLVFVHVFTHPSAGLYRLMMARATRRPSTAALMMPPAYPAPSPQG